MQGFSYTGQIGQKILGGRYEESLMVRDAGCWGKWLDSSVTAGESRVIQNANFEMVPYLYSTVLYFGTYQYHECEYRGTCTVEINTARSMTSAPVIE